MTEVADRQKGKISDIVCWTLCYSTEDMEKVKRALRNLTGDVATIETKKADSHFHHELEIVRAIMKGERDLQRIISALPTETVERILETLDSRLDDNNILHFRLDKQSCLSGQPRLSSELDPTMRKEHDSIDAEVHVVTYPGNRKNVVKFIRQMLLEIKTL